MGWCHRRVRRTHMGMEADRFPLPLDFGNLPLGSLYEDRLVEDLLLLVDVVAACREGDDDRLAALGVCGAALPATSLAGG
jgi:hypothetical protein